MKPNAFLHHPGLLLQSFFLVIVCCSVFLTAISQEKKPPNIIFILTDDQRWDALGFAGNTIIQTPEMDKLAKAGTYFKNAFATTPICAASRASILTGLYERTHNYTFQKTKLQTPYADIIYPNILKEHGYYTGLYGKLGVVMDSAKKYFDESDFYDRGADSDRRGYFYKLIGDDTVHLTRYTGNQAQEFIKHAPADKPFCLSLFFSAPHAHDPSDQQYYWQAKSDELYKNDLIPPPLLSDDKFFNDLPLEVKQGFNRTRWKWRFDNEGKYQNSIKGYYRMISEIDNEIGMLRNILKEKGVDKNTIIIIMGDNGYFTGDRQLADKWLMYDASIRIPLLIFDPRNTLHASIDAMVLNIDVSKSILQFAGIDPPKNYQGNTLLPFIKKGNISSKRKSILIEHLWKLPEIPSSEGIRTAKWKYFRYRYIKAPEELYDLQNDPLETINLATTGQFSYVINRLRKQCDKLSAKYQSEKLCQDEPADDKIKF